MADAEVNAEQLAELAGVGVDKPTYISGGAYFQLLVLGPMHERVAAAPAVETPISPEEMEITLTVQVTYSVQ